MPSNNDLSFHVPSAGLRPMESAASPGVGAFSHLHLVGNPDWMSSFSANQQVAAARPVLAPPAPVASESLAMSAPAAIDAAAAAAAAVPAKKGFLSMFYRAPTSAAVAPAPPRALDAFDTPPQRALPVDAQLSLEHLSKFNTAVEASIAPAPRREPPRPMALGSDTWNALSGVPLPPKAIAVVGSSTSSSASAAARLMAPPVSIDGVANRAPKPLWSDLSFASRFRKTAPTLEAFRNAPPAPILSTPPDSPVLQSVAASPAPVKAAASVAVPVPPKPLTTSPLRDTAVANSLEAAAAANVAPPVRREQPRAAAHPLVPVGEEARAAVTPLLKPVAEAPAVLASATTAAAAKPAAAPTPVHSTSPTWSTEPLGLAHGDMEAMWLPTPFEAPASPLPSTEFTLSVAEPVTRQAQRDEARAAANVRNFIRTIFSRKSDDEGDSPTSGTAKADGFNALEMVTNRRSTQAKASQPVGYSTFFSSSLFEDDCDEDSEEGLEKLRRVVSIVMQAAKSHDGTSSTSQPPSQSSRRGGGGGAGGNGGAAMPAASPFTSRYTEFSASYQTSHTGNSSNSAAYQNDWSNLARF